MPNDGNVTSPCVLLAYGRVGSTLLLDVFRRHKDIHALGETIHLIFNTWLDKEQELREIKPDLAEGEIENQCGQAVRNNFLRIFQDPRLNWFQKPIGTPNAFFYKFDEFDESDWPRLADWYWKVMENSFPDARYFTVLRHPMDIILSAKKKWNTPEERTWRNLALVAYLLIYPKSRVDYAISYDDLVQKPEETLKLLFGHLQLDFNPESLEAFSTFHLPSPGRQIKAGEVPNWKKDWESLNLSYAAPYLELIEEAFHHFKKPILLPSNLRTKIISFPGMDNGFMPEDAGGVDIKQIKTEYILKIKQALRYGDDLRTYCLDLENRLSHYERKNLSLEKQISFNNLLQIKHPTSTSQTNHSIRVLELFDQRTILLGDRDQSAIWKVTMDQGEEQAIFLHPPAAIGITVRDGRQAYLYSAVGMHPDVWGNPQSGGCIFIVTADDRVQYQIWIDPIHNEEERGWQEFILKIPAHPLGFHQITFECRTLDGKNDFRWALWKEPFLELRDWENRT